MKPNTSSTLWRAALVGVVLLTLAARLVPGVRTIDDAYITFRYARNLLAGRGFVYNPGQRVQGTTTPLYTLLMAAEKWILGDTDLPTLAVVTNALADAASVVVLAWLGWWALKAPGLGIAAGLLWALSPMSVTFAIGGMETSVYVLLLLLALASYAGGRSGWSALFCALATLTRPDALLLVVPLFAHMVWERFRCGLREKRARTTSMEDSAEKVADPQPTGQTAYCGKVRGIAAISKSRLWMAEAPRISGIAGIHFTARVLPWREAGIFLLILTPWLVFATLYFGSPLAHSIVAKSAAYRLEPHSALVRLIQHYATPFFEDAVLGVGWVAVGAIGYLFLSLLGGLAMIRRGVHGRLFPLVVYPWLYLIAFSLYNPLLFRWYLAPVLPMYTLCILYGVDCLLNDLASALSHRWPAVCRAVRVLEGLLVLAAVGMLINAWTLHPDHGPDRPAPEMAWFKLEQLYRRAVVDLIAHQPVTPETRIAAGDIGVIGYLSGARILDTVGLVSPEAVSYYPLPEAAYVISYAVSPELILAERPDYAILLEAYVRNTLQRSQAFAGEYEVYRRWPTDIYGSQGLLVYRRQGMGQ